MNGKGNTAPPLPPRLLNFGCGSALHPEWINLDSSAVAPGVIAYDLRHGLPFPPDSFDAAYGSHVLEHLEPDAAARLLRSRELAELRAARRDGQPAAVSE